MTSYAILLLHYTSFKQNTPGEELLLQVVTYSLIFYVIISTLSSTVETSTSFPFRDKFSKDGSVLKYKALRHVFISLVLKYLLRNTLVNNPTSYFLSFHFRFTIMAEKRIIGIKYKDLLN